MIKKIFLSLILAAAFVFAADPITIEGRLTEIPGKMPSNDLYSYVYVFSGLLMLCMGIYILFFAPESFKKAANQVKVTDLKTSQD